jgi:DNA-binding MurR/RpiR family transcriptional regulator
MSKTIRELADQLGVSKQSVYRFIKKNRISEAHHEAHHRSGVMYYDDTVESLLLQHFSKTDRISEAHHEAHQNRITDTVSDTLLKQLEIKDKQIEELSRALDQEQQLHAATKQEMKLLLEAPKKHKWFWQKDV